jgi:predicted metalloprotease with PDZ domain
MKAASITVALAALPALAQGPPAAAPLYALSYPADRASRVEIRIELPEPVPAPLVLAFPRAVPLIYGEQAYERFVTDVRAFGPASGELVARRLDGPRWQLGAAGRSVSWVRYEVDLSWMENEVRRAVLSSKTRPGYAGILGHTVFAYLEGLSDQPLRFTLSAPQGWPVFSSLAPAAPAAAEPLAGVAADYRTLADSFIAMGPAIAVERREAEATLYVVVAAQGEVSRDLLVQLGGQALNAAASYFGEPPFPHYTVLAEFLRPLSVRHEYGESLAHLDGLSLAASSDHPIAGEPASDDVRALLFDLTLRAAQAWMPLRCSGTGLREFPWELAPVLDTLWLDEGFPRYAAMTAVAGPMGTSTGALVERDFADALSASSPVLRGMSAVELSRLASTRDPSDPRVLRQARARGGMMAAEMDALIREQTAQRKSLRDGLRRVIARCAERDAGVLRLDELPALVQAGSGVDVRRVYDKWIGPQPD